MKVSIVCVVLLSLFLVSSLLAVHWRLMLAFSKKFLFMDREIISLYAEIIKNLAKDNALLTEVCEKNHSKDNEQEEK